MSFLSTKSLKKEIKGLVGSENHPVDVVAVVLHIGGEIFITGNSTKQQLGKDEPFSIPPGQFALLITEESIQVPRNRMGFITIKFSLKKKGLVNISGFHVDPGFKGNLLFSVYNAGANAIPLSRGTDAFRMWLAELDGEADEYNGKHQGQSCISENDVSLLMGHVASPAALQNQIDDNARDFQDQMNNIQSTLSNYWHIIIALLAPVVLAITIPAISDLLYPNDSSKGNPSVVVIQGKAGSLVLTDSVGVIVADSVIIFGPSRNGAGQTNQAGSDSERQSRED